MHYVLVEPEHFTDAHQRFLRQFSHSVELISSCSDAILDAKDIQSRHLMASDPYAHIVGLSLGKDVIGRMDADMPCQDVARFAECCVRQDRRFLRRSHMGSIQTVLKIHRYDDRPRALVFDKFLLKHHPSQSVLGIVYSAFEIDIDRFTLCFPRYWDEFGFGCSIERAEHPAIDGLGKLSAIEHEVAFLLALGFDTEAIGNVLPRLRPGPGGNVDAALFGIADKASAAGVPMASLRNCLIEAFVHQRMPKSFFSKVVGLCA